MVGLGGLAALLVGFDSSVLVLTLPAIASDFRASVPALTDLGSVLALGSLLGLPAAVLADRVGRRGLLAAGVAGLSLANLASAAAPGLVWLAAARTVAVGLETLVLSVASTLMVEEMPAGRRGLAISALMVAAGAGTFFSVVLYPLLAPHWRILYVIGAAGLLAAPLVARFLPESEIWAAAPHEALPLFVLTRSPWRRRLAAVLAAGAVSEVFFGPATYLVVWFGSRHLGLAPTAISAVIFVSGAVSIPAFGVGAWLSNRFGRKRPAVALSLLTALCAVVSFSAGQAGFWAGNLAWSVCASASVPVIGPWLGELFPTRARASAETAASLAGALGGGAGLLLVGLLEPRLGLAFSLQAAALAAGLGAGLLLALPETKEQPLPT